MSNNLENGIDNDVSSPLATLCCASGCQRTSRRTRLASSILASLLPRQSSASPTSTDGTRELPCKRCGNIQAGDENVQNTVTSESKQPSSSATSASTSSKQSRSSAFIETVGQTTNTDTEENSHVHAEPSSQHHQPSHSYVGPNGTYPLQHINVNPPDGQQTCSKDKLSQDVTNHSSTTEAESSSCGSKSKCYQPTGNEIESAQEMTITEYQNSSLSPGAVPLIEDPVSVRLEDELVDTSGRPTVTDGGSSVLVTLEEMTDAGDIEQVTTVRTLNPNWGPTEPSKVSIQVVPSDDVAIDADPETCDQAMLKTSKGKRVIIKNGIAKRVCFGRVSQSSNAGNGKAIAVPEKDDVSFLKTGGVHKTDAHGHGRGRSRNRLFPCFSHRRSSSSESSSSNGAVISPERSNLNSAQIAAFANDFRAQLSTVSQNANSSSSAGNGDEEPAISTPSVTWAKQAIVAMPYPVHTQVEYTHFLIPKLDKIYSASYYWGIMDRFKAEKLLENRCEGSFLLRDSAQPEFSFSVSFRRYGRTLHARIDQLDHRFSFDCYDSQVFSATNVTDLVEHYTDPAVCLFYEPLLSVPVKRKTVFSLQSLARGKVCSDIMYGDITHLDIPKRLKEYLQEYHYRRPVRVRKFDY